MRSPIQTTLCSVILASFLSIPGLAQDKDQTQDRDRDQLQTQDQDRLRVHTADELIDTLYAAELLEDRDRDRLRDQLRDADSDQDRDRIRDQIQQRLYTRAWEQGVVLDQEPLYGGDLMTAEERARYRNQLQSAQTAEERERLRAQHRTEIQARAKERGLNPGDAPVYGRELMTKRERKKYQKQLDGAANAEARERIRAEHRQEMQVRAWERGLNPDHEPIYGGHMMTAEQRAQFRQRLESAGNAEGRAQVRAEHRQQIKEIAKARNMKLGDEPIYGGELMTKRQRKEYRTMLQEAGSAARREQLMASHREAMANHAWEHGIFPGREPVYGGHMMTEQERANFRQQMQSAGSAAAREQIRAEHRNLIQERARLYDLKSGEPPVFGGEMMGIQDRQRYQNRLNSAASAGDRERMRYEHAAQMQSRMRREGINPMDPGRMRSMNQQRFEQQQRGMSNMGGMQQGGGGRGR